jgi:hypothetical protein
MGRGNVNGGIVRYELGVGRSVGRKLTVVETIVGELGGVGEIEECGTRWCSGTDGARLEVGAGDPYDLEAEVFGLALGLGVACPVDPQFENGMAGRERELVDQGLDTFPVCHDHRELWLVVRGSFALQFALSELEPFQPIGPRMS